jgi:hypothetical protein
MADYYPLLARAVAALPNSTRDTRAAIYERARKALLGQLRSLDPPVSEEHLQNESDALDSAIARLEAELAQDPAPAASAQEPMKPAAPPRQVPPPPSPSAAPPSPSAVPPPLSTAPPPTSAAPPVSNAGLRPPPPPPPLAHAAPAVTPKPADAAKVAAPPPLSPPTPQTPPAKPVSETAAPASAPPPPKPAPEPETPAVIARPPTSRGDSARPVAPSRPESRGGMSRQMLIWIPLVLFIGGGIAFAAWRLRVPQEEFAKPRATVAEAARPQGAAKINERADAPGSSPSPTPAQPSVAQAPVTQTPPAQQPQRAPAQPATPPAQTQAQQAAPAQPAPQRPAIVEQAAPVAQRSAILVQAAVNDMQNVETHVGTTVWRQEESRRPGANGSPAIRADVDIPAVGLKFVFLIEKNNDTTLRASHMLTVRFLPQEGSPLPAIAEIGSPQMRNEASASVEPLAGVQAKITDNIYIIALNADPTLVTRNLDTLRTRGWFDFPIRLADGRIAKITVEKGAPGDRLIEQALDVWQR